MVVSGSQTGPLFGILINLLILSSSVADIILPRPLLPPYLPTKPVSMVWSRKHSTSQLYRYTHIERLVYPHERLIVPPAFIQR